MRSSASGTATVPIPPETRRLAGILARAKTGEILALLHRHPYQTASEVARSEDVHIATAQRYLRELVDAGVLGMRTRPGGPRSVDEYWVLDPRIRIDIDLETSAVGNEVLRRAADQLTVRDRAPANVVYDTDPRTGDVQGLLVLSEAHPRLVADRIRLPTAVGRFLTHLPYAAGDHASVWDIMQRAGLDESHLEEVLASIGRLTGMRSMPGLDPAVPPSTRQGPSARPLDPEMQRLFDSLRGHGGIQAAPPVPVLEIAARPFPGPSASTPGTLRASRDPDPRPPRADDHDR